MTAPTTRAPVLSGSAAQSPTAFTPAERAAILINAKYAGLLHSGFDLGPPAGPLVDASYGGFFQAYERGRIYHHPAIGEHEVHGGVLARYLECGGHDLHPGTRRRELGFPMTDEVPTADGRRVHSVFEWGAVYWSHGGNAVFGPIYQSWKALQAELGPLGYPVTTHLPAGGLDAVYFEGGCIIAGGPLSAPVVGRTDAPTIGRPAILNPSDDRIPAAFEFDFAPAEWEQVGATRLLALLHERLALYSVGRMVSAVPLVPVLERVTAVVRPPGAPRVAVRVAFRAAPGFPPRDRTLYDLVVRLPGGPIRTARPHAFYAKTSWASFGVVHATDVHVSRRLDGFRAKLEGAGRLESAGLVLNPNNTFRDLVRHLNRLHAAGEVDVLMATGDLVDYAFEYADHPKGGGNFALFEDILLGRSPYPDRPGVAVEELRVPIFTTLGNHDYRGVPYPLRFELEVPYWFNRHIDNYRAFNLTQGDAVAIQGGTPSISKDAAIRMTRPVRPAYYFDRINPRGASYVVPLGAHRLVMLDTGPDVGLVDSTGDAIAAAMGWHTEDEGQFMSGSPNSEGVSAQEVALLREAVRQAGPSGLVLVGLHAPPLNPKGDEFPNYFRETARVSGQQEDEVVGFLARQAPVYLPNVAKSFPEWRKRARERHPEWFTGGEHFKRRRQGDLLDAGVARGETQTLLELCAGSEGRPVDLVLFGHVHRHVEYRLSWDAGAGQVRYHTDFYTESPRAYYPMRLVVPTWPPQHVQVLVDVFPGAAPQGAPSRLRDRRGPWGQDPRVEVPPYHRPLAETTDPRGWWDVHRPLLMQTGPLGPTESNTRRHLETNPNRPGPSFRGARLISVRDNVIARITFLPASTIASGVSAAAAAGGGRAGAPGEPALQ